ncbi:hypothetical protein CDAR_592841 [Caerostris darwini]|uniref:Uncharacterized protein n=1 Tax=Caerostris darwini TaxID=1538125 RepID=A0AAV4QP64_9ARAC|nr:hypothetical protein CDAR_592841 [Caerostris darwini]
MPFFIRQNFKTTGFRGESKRNPMRKTEMLYSRINRTGPEGQTAELIFPTFLHREEKAPKGSVSSCCLLQIESEGHLPERFE